MVGLGEDRLSVIAERIRYRGTSTDLYLRIKHHIQQRGGVDVKSRRRDHTHRIRGECPDWRSQSLLGQLSRTGHVSGCEDVRPFSFFDPLAKQAGWPEGRIDSNAGVLLIFGGDF